MKPVLETILESTRARVDRAKNAIGPGVTRGRAFAKRDVSGSHSFAAAIRRPDRLNVIAEFKKASPSKGVINDIADPVETARKYEASRACAISVLTEPEFFRGSLEDLRAIRSEVSIPILRKDFVIDEYQIYEAAEAGADAVLLIAAALQPVDLQRFRSLVEDELRMDALVEVHTADEMAIARDLGATVIGVNNRNLRTFEVSLAVSRELIGLAPKGAVLVSESGITTRNEMIELQSLGYSAFLIGESLMRGGEVEALV